MNIQGKVIAITGGAQGLGLATARYLAAQGAQLALIDLDAEKLEVAAKACQQEVGDHSPEIRCYTGNVASENEVEAVFAAISRDFGALHGLVNNAGITRDALLIKASKGVVEKRMSLQQWQSVMDVNLTGVFLCGREAATKMIELGCEGAIINIASISKAGNIGQTNYSAAKAGVEAMSVTWAKELARYGIRSASIAPGYMETEMVAAMKPEALEMMTRQIPLKRLGQPEHIARTVSFILENDYVSGRTFEIDAGLRI
ncbi:SDR family oxidoreductase [Pseudomaricurvus alkylphenolicus]|jgi:3-oxoacyl-[acyl-carrier protein] reductase|uniref:SDR family oxidoreductase n=1 Tax=Pseudomaricurvus alkylphenolicus TaxID=1306991 RepID=UPI0014205E04|nr:SDR family oxidoreductase [Pseudomaricurvus alkylphenolicus]NIB40450.1 SDR family oxidoreductase [Pseudomaricurvus alkylphenolicus]